MLRNLLARSFARAGSLTQPGQRESGHLVRLEEPAELLQQPHRQQILHQIAGMTALPPEHYRSLVLAAIERYAAFVQRLPASEAHHHAGLGGMLDHGLEVTLQALLIRRGKLLPVGAEPERIGTVHDLWTYAVFTAAVLHDIGKPAVDQEVVLYDGHGRALGPWDPWCGPMSQLPGCRGYAIRFRRGRRHRFHERASPLLAHHIVPARGLAWLSSDQDVFGSWLATISGDMDAAGPLGEIIQQADGLSVARNLGAGDAVRAVPGRSKALWERLLTGLRYLVLEGELPLNRNGAAGWLVEDDLWLVSKRAIDALRAHLGAEGHSGIPSKNDRIYDTLQEHGVLEACGDRAIWRATVAGDGWSHDLTLIRIRAHRIWPQAEDRPEPFAGSVTPIQDAGASSVAGMQDSAETSERRAVAGPGLTSARSLPEPAAPPGDRRPGPAGASDAYSDLPMPTLAPVDDEDQATFPVEPVTTDSGSPAPDPAPHGQSDAQVTRLPPGAAQDSDARVAADPAADPGRRVLAWLKSEAMQRRLVLNSAQARVHVVAEGVLLVSPAVFKDFADRFPDAGSWEHIQKRFMKLRLHQKLPDGTNVHRYRVTGERRQSVIKGILIPEVSAVFGSDVAWPSPNPHLTSALAPM
jgi:integrating conjugative element relaxase (TIGR03760 family)